MADQQDAAPSWAPQAQPAPALPSWAPGATSAPAAAPPQVPMAGDNAPAYQAVSDKLFQQTKPGALAAVATQAMGLDEPLGLSEETSQHLRDAGIFNDFAKGQNDFIKNFNEAVLRPAAIVGDTAMRAINTAFVGTAGAVGAGVDALEGTFGMQHESAQTNAYHAQDFADYLYINAGFTAEGVPMAAQAVKGKMTPPMPPSAGGALTVVQDAKPWQADIPAAEEAAPGTSLVTVKAGEPGVPPVNVLPPGTEPIIPQSTSLATTKPPINNLPAPGSAEAKAAESAVPANPADPINHTNPIIDGSGNLNLNFIRADQDTKDVMAKVSQAYAEQYGTEVPHIETVESAQAFMDEAMGQVTNGIPDALGDFARGDAVSRDLLWTARQLGVQLATETGRLARVAATTGAPEDQAAAEAAFTRMVQVVGPIRHEVTAEAGRILESAKIPVGENLPVPADGGPAITEEAATKLAGMDAQDAVKLLGSMQTPQDVAKFVQDMQKPSFADMGLYYIFNNFLSGPITHLAYMAAWGVQTVIRAGLETPLASAVGGLQKLAGKTLAPEEVGALNAERMSIADRLAEADSRQGRKLTAVERAPLEARMQEIADRLKNKITVMPKEAAARFYGIGEGALDSIRAFGRALKTSDIQMLPGEMQKAEDAAKEATAAALKKGMSSDDAKKAGEAAYQDNAINFGNPIVRYGQMVQDAGNGRGSRSFAKGETIKAVGQVVGIPMRVIAALHSLQKFSGYAESMNALAYRQAATEGLEGDAMAARMAAIKNNPTPEMMQQATTEAKYAALMGKSGKVGTAFQKLANSNAWTRVVVPFSKVVTNLTAQKVLERTPIGLLSPVVRGNIMGANGNAAQATQIAKMLTGSTLLTGGAYLAAQGVSRGWGSDDKDERAFQYLSGNAPYSVTIGDVNLPHRFFGVAGGSLSLGADIHDISQVMDENDEHWNDWMAVMGHSIHYIGRDILSENALTGPANLYNAINDRENAAKNFVPNAIASAFTPFSSFQTQVTQRFIDPIMRLTTGKDTATYDDLMQLIQSRTPFLSNTLMPKVDIFGNPMQRDSDHSWAEKDPVMQALTHLQIYPAAIQPKLFGVNLDEKQFADYATIAGKLFYNQLLPQTSNPNWVRLPDRAQAEIVQTAIKSSRAQAKATMNLLYPQIAKDGAQQKIDLLNQYDDDAP